MKKTELRQQAEALVSKRKKSPKTGADNARLIHELEVHQIELELQNEELIRARAEAEENHRQYADLYDFAPVGYFTLTRDGTISQVNLTGAALLDAERGKLLKRRFGVFVSPKSRPAMNAFLEKVISSGEKQTCEVELLKGKTESFWAQVEAAYDDTHETCRVVVMDISAHTRTEQSLQLHVSELEMLYQSSLEFNQLQDPNLIWKKTLELLKEKMNWHHTSVRLYNQKDDSMEAVYFDVSGPQNAAYIERRQPQIKNSGDGMSGWAIQFGKPIRSGDVSRDPHYIEIYPGINSGLYVPMKLGENIAGVLSIESEQPNAYSQAHEHLVVTMANQAIGVFEKIRLLSAIQRELGERKKAEEEVRELNATLEQRIEEGTRELQEAQAQLIRQERLAALGQIAGSMGHELRNPLGVISNAVYFLKMAQPDADEKIKEYLDIIENQTFVSSKIIGDLLDFTRVKSIEFAAVAVAQLITQTLERFPAPESVQIKLDLPAELPQAFVDAQHIVQILGNLFTNAYQAQKDSTGVHTVAISARMQAAMICIAVQDSGAGISPENMKRLFEPLFTTRAKGVGLGLAVSKKLAEANGGEIKVESKVGVGSVFSLYLPILTMSD